MRTVTSIATTTPGFGAGTPSPSRGGACPSGGKRRLDCTRRSEARRRRPDAGDEDDEEAMPANASTLAVMIVSPGSRGEPSSIPRNATPSKTTVAASSAKVSWCRRSRSNALTMRGENWPIASCTATVMTVSTTDRSDTTAVMVVRAASAPRPGGRRSVRRAGRSPLPGRWRGCQAPAGPPPRGRPAGSATSAAVRRGGSVRASLLAAHAAPRWSRDAMPALRRPKRARDTLYVSCTVRSTTRVWRAASTIVRVTSAVTVFLDLRAALSFASVALTAFRVPFGVTLSVVLLPAASEAVVVVSLIAFLTPLILTVPLAVTTTRPPPGRSPSSRSTGWSPRPSGCCYA